MSTTRLPALPSPPNYESAHDEAPLTDHYSAGQMHAYGLAVWKAAMQHAAGLAKQMKPAGGRAWSEAQAAVFLALDDLEIALASLPLPEQGSPQERRE